jgi:TetR/AcrR family transcriptional regulator, repressor for neighboring sulfatase
MARVKKQARQPNSKRTGKPALTTKATQLALGREAREAQVRRPRGRQEVMAAVLDAATALFAARGPASVSVRDLANAARVNHALVHRHFRSKQAVLRAVLERTATSVASIADRISDPREGVKQLFAVTAEHENYCRALARAILDGEDPRKLQRDFPTIRKMIELLRSRQPDHRIHSNQRDSIFASDARVVIGATSALTLGWLLFEPFVLAATGLDKYALLEVRARIAQILQVIIDSASDRLPRSSSYKKSAPLVCERLGRVSPEERGPADE